MSDRLSMGVAAVGVLAYVLWPNPMHPWLSGIPLSVVGTVALILWLLRLLWHAPAGWRLATLVSVAVVVKAGTAAVLPWEGYEAAYYANGDFAGIPLAGIDRRLAFDARTFPRDRANDFVHFHFPPGEIVPLSTVWRGYVRLERPATLDADIQTSVAVAATGNGIALPVRLEAGVHEIRVHARTLPPVPPALTVRLRTDAEGDVPVFATPPSRAGLVARRTYRGVATVLDAAVVAILIATVAGAVRRAVPETRRFRIAALVVIGVWVLIGAVRTGPHFAETELSSRSDDWLYYEAMARSILAGLHGADCAFSKHYLPSSFAYSYVLALLHWIFGPHTWPIYFAQHVLLGGACVGLGRIARRLWGTGIGMAVMVSATVIGFLDVSRWYTMRTLSENLALPAIVLTFLVLAWHLERPRLVSALVMGAVLGGFALVRFDNLAFVAVAMGCLMFVRPSDDAPGRRWACRVMLVAGVAAIYLLFPLREYLVSGEWEPFNRSWYLAFKKQDSSIVEGMNLSLGRLLQTTILPNIAYMLGTPKFMVPQFSLRPHWFVLWVVYGVWFYANRRTPLTLLLALLNVYLVLYVSVQSINYYISSYGFRYLLPLVFLLSLFFPAGVREIVRTVSRRPATAVPQPMAPRIT